MTKNTSRPAFIWERTGKNSGRWLEAGIGHELEGNAFSIQLDRMPVNPENFSGYICVPPDGQLPTAAELRECKRLEMETASRKR